jgi:hypothetical protein
MLDDTREQASRLVPISAEEIYWARRRPEQHRTPIPRTDDWVLYRDDQWSTELWRARVLQVQSMTDEHPDWGHPREDANMFIFRADVPLVPDGHGGLLDVPEDWFEPHPDPWPVLRLRIYPPNRTPRLVDTREARVRGAAGWLPLDWRARYRPVPSPSAPAVTRSGLIVPGPAPAPA